MKFKPSATEQVEVESYSSKERLYYFLTRAIESEEIWGLSNHSGWVMKEENAKTILPVWPYEQMAKPHTLHDWKDHSPGAVSLEHFVYNLLPVMIEQDILVEVLPTETRPGKLIEARELASLFEGMLESGEYYMEG